MNSRKRILIVDNNQGTIHLVRDALKGSRYSIQVAITAEDGLDLLEKEDADLVISEGMTGVEFLNELREWDQDLPVVFICEKNNKHQLEPATVHTNATITKPLKKESIVRTISRVLDDQDNPASY